jgi:hypothetical protein
MEPPDGPIDPLLVRAYRDTHYRVDGPDGAFTMRVDAPCDALAALMRGPATATAAFLTAFDPWSLPRPAADNLAAQRALEAELAALGCGLLQGEGRDPSGHWPPEPSVLAFGLTLEQATDLARRHGQNAFVWIERAGAPCRLVTTRPVGGSAPRPGRAAHPARRA